MYIFSSGGDESGKYGLSMWYSRKRLYLTVSTKTKIWTVYVPFKKYLNTFVNIEFSWSVQGGLSLYFDGFRVAQTKEYFRRITASLSGKFYLGRPIGVGVYCWMVIDGWDIAEGTKDIVKDLDVTVESPEIKVRPVMTIEENTNGTANVFRCKFEKLEEDGLLYKVLWSINDNSLKQMFLPKDVYMHELEEDDIQKLEFKDKLSCSIMACRANEDCSPWRESNVITADIKLKTTELTVYEGMIPGHVEITATVPPYMFCLPDDRKKYCDVLITTKLLRANKEKKCPKTKVEIVQAVFGVWDASEDSKHPCEYRITKDNWRDVIMIPVKASIDSLKDKNQKRDIEVTLFIYRSGIAAYTSKLGIVELEVKDRDKTATCKSINDPHMTTFDKLKYNNFYEGEFVLYRHKTLPYAVHVFFLNCNGKASCNCAVAVQSGDDVILIDMCEQAKNKEYTKKGKKKSKKLDVKMFLNGELTEGTIVERIGGGKTYKIYLPTGAYIKVKKGKKRTSQFINVQMKASSSDFGMTEGLCGVFDDDKTNDLTLRSGEIYGSNEKQPKGFSRDWRVPASESLFSGYCPTKAKTVDIGMYCNCMEDETNECAVGLDYQECKEIEKRKKKSYKKKGRKDVTAKLIEKAESPVARCISTANIINFEFDINYEQAELSWPTKTGITLTMARKICVEYIQARPVAQRCIALPGMNEIFELTVESCIEDIQITDDITWTFEAVEDVEDTGLVIIEIDIDFWVTVGDDVIPDPQIADNICPNECSNHGTCKENECICTGIWIGDDCSIDSTLPPEVTYISSQNPCDHNVKKYKCLEPVIVGANFADTDNLTCHYEVLYNNLTSTGEMGTVLAEYINEDSVSCALPRIAIYNITVSNNGIEYSDWVTHLVYNGYCDTCTEDDGCTLRNDICYINEVCYENGFILPADPRVGCRIAISVTDWTVIQVDSVRQYRLFFIRMDGTSLVVPSGTIATFGGMSLDVNVNNKLSLSFNGADQYLKVVSSSGGCLYDPEQCFLGITLSFTIKFRSLKENTYYYTNCGDQSDSAGYAIYYKNERLYFKVSTKTREWTVFVSDVKTDKYYDIQMSWSVQFGLNIYINLNKVGDTTDYLLRNVETPTKCDLYLGRPNGNGEYADMVMEYWHILLASREVLISIGFVIGYPSVKNPPVLKPELDRFGESKFTCDFDRVTGYDVKYTVKFYLNEDVLREFTITRDDDFAILDENDFHEQLYGTAISCTVEVCYADSCDQSKGEVKVSNTVYVAFKFSQEGSIVLHEGQPPTELTLQSYIPPRLFCTRGARDYSCKVELKASIRPAKELQCSDGTDLSQVVFFQTGESAADTCGTEVSTTEWKNEFKLFMKARIDGINDGDKKRSLQLEAVVTQDDGVVKYDIGRIELDIKDRDRRVRCRSKGHPHIKTFDKKKYHNYLEGEFILYRTKSNLYEVRTFQRKCRSNSKTACNCAVAIRAEDDVILFDVCGADYDFTTTVRSLTKKIYKNGDLTAGFTVEEEKKGKIFTITLPNGASVKIEKRKKYLQVWVTAGPVDFENVEGLCGNFDDNKDNDYMKPDGTFLDPSDKYPNDFSKSWRVPTEETIYNGFCGNIDAPADIGRYCECNSGQDPVCSNNRDITACAKISKKKAVDITNELPMEEPVKCSTTVEQIFFIFDINFNITITDLPPWPVNGITEIKARDKCTTDIKLSVVGVACLGFGITIDFDDIIEDCVLDVQLNGDYDFIVSSISELRVTCMFSIETNITLLLPEGPDEIEIPEFLDNICVDDCNEQGTCVESVCQCNANYTGTTCDTLLTDPPILNAIFGGVACDLDTNEYNCTLFIVQGVRFIDNDSLTCHFELENGVKVTSVGDFKSTEEVWCPFIGDLGQHKLSISNDGLMISNELTFVVYTSACKDCTDLICVDRDDICTISGVCYELGALNMLNTEQFCNTTTSRTSWSTLIVSEITPTRYNFVRITGTTLVIKISITIEININLIGTPVLIDIPSGEKGVMLNGIDQALDFGDLSNTCLGDIEKCSTGLTITFNLKLRERKDNCYIMSTGGEDKDSYGLAMWYSKKGKLYTRVSTSKYEWTVYTKDVEIDEYFNVKLAWSRSEGLAFYKNNKRMKKSKKRQKRKGSKHLKKKCYFGRSTEPEPHFCKMEIDGFTEIPASEQVVDIIDVPLELPTMEKDPVLKVIPSNDTFDLRCTFEPLTTPYVNYRYTVRWYLGDAVKSTFVMENDSFVSQINKADIGVAVYGDEVRCAVSACYYDNCDNTAGPDRMSNEFKLHIKILTEKIELYEGFAGKCINVKPMVPPSTFCDNGTCHYRIDYGFEDREKYTESTCADESIVPQAVFLTESVQNSPCHVVISEVDWEKETCVYIRAVADGLKDKNKKLHVRLTISVEIVTTIVTQISQTSYPTVEVEIIDQDKTAVCESSGDPHITTYDGRTYDNMLEGEFIMYRHKTLPYEVRALLRACNEPRRASCNCGALIRIGDDVIVFDKCGAKKSKKNKKKPLKPKLYLNGELTPGTSIIKYKGGKNYKVVFPSGTYVRLESHKNGRFINMYVRASSSDLEKTEGLCGFFDGDDANDLMKPNNTLYGGKSREVDEFSSSWRIDELGVDSMYSGYCPQVVIEKQTILPPYCNCGASTSTCYSNIDDLGCARYKKDKKEKGKYWKKAKDVTEYLVSKAISPPSGCIATQIEVFEANITYIPTVRTWPTPTGRTEIAALQECKAVIEADISFAGCKSVAAINLVAALDSCVIDLQITDNIEWSQAALDTVLTKCQIEIEINIELWVNVSGSLIPNPAIIDNICPGSCSGNGNCVEGVCVCTGNFAGEDCSVDTTAVIVLEPLEQEFCDKYSNLCTEITLIGDGFLETSVIQCAIIRQKKLAVFVDIGDEILINATYISQEAVTCDLPDPDIFKITIINNNIRSIDSLTYVTYDPFCYDCTTAGCTVKPDVCLIGDNCYGKGFFDVGNAGLGCIPNTDTTTWTIITQIDITVLELTFIEITGTILKTPNLDITVHGTILPTLTDIDSIMYCPLDGISQYLDLGDKSNSCLGNPLLCGFGMTIQFNLKIIQFVENMYIFTSGGDQPDGYGVAMYYKRSELYLTVSTKTMEWTVKTKININVVVNIEFSWSIQTGLALFFDGTMVAETKTFITREVTVSMYTATYIGVSIDIKIFAQIEIGELKITEATRETIATVDGDETTTDIMTTEMITNATTTEMVTNGTETTTDQGTTTDIGTTTESGTTTEMGTSTEGGTTTAMGTTTEAGTTTEGETLTDVTATTTEATTPTDGTATTTEASTPTDGTATTTEAGSTSEGTTAEDTATSMTESTTTGMSDTPTVTQTAATTQADTITEQPTELTTTGQLMTASDTITEQPTEITTTGQLMTASDTITEQPTELTTTGQLMTASDTITVQSTTETKQQTTTQEDTQTQETGSVESSSIRVESTTQNIEQTEITSPVATTSQVLTSTESSVQETTTKSVDTTVVDTTESLTTDSPTSTVVETTVQTTQQTTTPVMTTEQTTQGCIGANNSYPVITINPSLSNTISNDKSAVTYTCQVATSTEAGAIHKVMWYVGTSLLKESTVTTGNVVMLNSKDDMDTSQRASALNDGVSCGVTVSNPNRCGDGVSPELNSTVVTPFQQTVDIPDQITLVEGEPSTSFPITISQNYDLYCTLTYGKSCDIEIVARTVVPVAKKKCFDGNDIDAIAVESDSTDPTTATPGVKFIGSTKTYSLKLKARIDRKNFKVPLTRQVKIVQIDTPSSDSLVEKIIKTVNVTLDDTYSTAQCQATGDPHIKTFDGTFYDALFTGEMIMYRNKDFQVEVRAYFSQCSQGSCICAVACRAGDDVIKLDKCPLAGQTLDAYPIVNTAFTRGNSFTPMFKEFQELNGERFQILLPTGTRVTVRNDHDEFMNLYIQPSAQDRNKTEGMCGSYSGTKEQDLVDINGVTHTLPDDKRPDDFSKSWRIAEGSPDSIYNGYTGTVSMPTPIYCVSFDDGSPQSCDYFKDIDLCTVHKNGVDKTQDLLAEEQDRNAEQQAEQQTVRRRKRDTTTPNAFTYDSTFNAPTVVTWPTNSGITLQQAKEHCEEAVKPTERAACVAIVGNTAPDVQSCINDVGLTDSKIWVDAVIQSIQEQCYTTVTTDENQWVDNSSGIPSINSTIDDNICLNDCSSAGTCLQGECNCNANRFGPDCSVKSTDKPIVLASYSNNVCDLSKLNCTQIQVYGAKFINSTDLTCHLTEVTVGTNGITNTLATEKVKAIYKSLAHVVCPNPNKKTVTVALSNDGNTPSDQQSIYVAYTSNCYTCTEDAATATATCTTNLASSCLIGSECYVKDTKSPTDQCMACRPSIATDSWSKVTGSGCEDKPPNEDGSEMNAVTIIAVSVTIAGLILIGIIVAGICVYRRTRLRKEKLESAGNSEIEYRSKNPNAMVPYFPPGQEWNYAYDHPTNSSVYRPQRIAFYDNRAALDDYFED